MLTSGVLPSRSQVRQRMDLATRNDLSDLAFDRLADPGQIGRASGERQFADRAGEVADPTGSPAISADAKRVAALQLDQIGQRFELGGNFGVRRQLHR